MKRRAGVARGAGQVPRHDRRISSDLTRHRGSAQPRSLHLTQVAIMINVIERLREDVAALCRLTGARRLDVFGSAARDDFDPATSDIDFLVDFDDDLPPWAYAQAYFTLKESLERLFGRPVDLVTSSSVDNPYFRERIDAERKPVYAR